MNYFISFHLNFWVLNTKVNLFKYFVYWVVREATRKSVQNKPLNFGSRELMVDYAKKLAKKKFGINLDVILSKSIIIRNIKTQKNLMSFLQ